MTYVILFTCLCTIHYLLATQITFIQLAILPCYSDHSACIYITNQNHFYKTTQTKNLSVWSVCMFTEAERWNDAMLLICSLPIWTDQTVNISINSFHSQIPMQDLECRRKPSHVVQCVISGRYQCWIFIKAWVQENIKSYRSPFFSAMVSSSA